MSIQFCFTEINSIVKLTETLFKGTLSVISSDPPCKDGNARFTTIPDVFFSSDCLCLFTVSLRK